MIGAIIGDIVGSVYEFDNIKTKEFPLFRKECFFTDDTVMTMAIYSVLADSKISKKRFIGQMHECVKLYPNKTYGNSFINWVMQFEAVEDDKLIDAYTNAEPYNSFGNGAAMKVSPFVLNADMENLKDKLELTEFVTALTHNHPEGIKGAKATVHLGTICKFEKDKNKLKAIIEKEYGYDLSRTVDELREVYQYNETCQRTVPEAMFCFIETTSFEDAIRNAISIGGDSDTLACITGTFAEHYYGVPKDLFDKALSYLDDRIGMLVEYAYKFS